MTVNLVEKLEQQLKFLQASCAAFDAGHESEALRIAVALRVLFHDTANSTSLLSHLGIKNSINIISTIGLKQKPQVSPNEVFYMPLKLSMEGVTPPLDLRRATNLSIENWWNEVILIQNEVFSRKDVTLTAANKDGGAHVDSHLDKKATELKLGLGTFSVSQDGLETTKNLTDAHFPLLRQIAFEVLNSKEITGYSAHHP
ncbi:hypothetical protein FVQ98_12600 [Ottowia sp. GY511]|uniref:AbiV family abortive infection protein n=1 Tax=Ottowia flava TaxID=2675430 RepID=A0ABW4KUD6_9BURK|nr:hypothetical protein [Ottowia sp. GY511]TXK27102.1 hypothetical protein FVQ98_12600 [Ottowia sp. GY511]